MKEGKYVSNNCEKWSSTSEEVAKANVKCKTLTRGQKIKNTLQFLVTEIIFKHFGNFEYFFILLVVQTFDFIK